MCTSRGVPARRSLLSDPGGTVFAGELPCYDVHQVHDPANAEAPHSQEPDNARTDFPGHEPMDAKLSQKKRNQNCCRFTHIFVFPF